VHVDIATMSHYAHFYTKWKKPIKETPKKEVYITEQVALKNKCGQSRILCCAST